MTSQGPCIAKSIEVGFWGTQLCDRLWTGGTQIQIFNPAQTLTYNVE